MTDSPIDRLRHHVSGAIERGEAEAITALELPDLIAAVRAHAAQHYDAGWDVVCEAWDDSYLGEMIDDAQSVKQAIDRVRGFVGLYVDNMLNSRPGEDSDWQLAMSKRYDAEKEAAEHAA
jgi:hypothetical protein